MFDGMCTHKYAMYYRFKIRYDQAMIYGDFGSEFINDSYLTEFDLIEHGAGLESFKYYRFLK